MSFLLDALRKSENRKHLGDVPTIHSTQSLNTGAAGKRGMAPVVLVLLPAFLVLIWVGSRQFATKENVPETQVAQASHAVVEPAPQRQQDRSQESSEQSAVDLSGSNKPSEPGPRTPVENFANPAEQTAPQSFPQLPSVKNDFVSESAGVSAGDPAPGSLVAVSMDSTPLPVSPNEPVTERVEPEPYQPPLPGTISYWQLPQSVRGDLTEFRISVLVYSEHPEDRFILLNGQRQIEGDSYQSGLVLEEIRRDGAVFSFRRYRFLVSQ